MRSGGLLTQRIFRGCSKTLFVEFRDGGGDCTRTVLMLIVFFASAQTFSFDLFLATFLYLESFGDLALVLLEFNETSGPQW